MRLCETAYCGSIWHHGIKGMKWGVRRTPEELGRAGSGVEKGEKDVTIIDGVYHSEKGFTVDQKKFSSWCLKEGTPHAGEFFGVGYKPTDADRLFKDIEKGFDLSQKRDRVPSGRTGEKFSIPMKLGVTEQKLFRTVWMTEGPDGDSRFITAYTDRRLEED